MKVEWVQLGDVLTPRAGQSIAADADYPIAGVYGFGRGILLRDPIHGFETKYKTLTRLSEGDVVFSKLKAFEGAITVVPTEGEGYFVSQEFPVFLVSSRVNDRYLDHFLKSPGFLATLAERSTGIGARRERVHPDQFLALPAPIPSRPDQDRIAAHLDSLSAHSLSGVNKARSLLTKVVLSASEGAPKRRIGSLLVKDRDWIELDGDTTYQPVGVSSFGNGMIRYSPTDRDGLSKMRYYYLNPGDLLVSNVMAWQGAVTVVEDTDNGRVANNRFLQYRPVSDDVTVRWLSSYFATAEGTSLLSASSHMHSPTNHTLALDAFEGIEVPVPTSKVQEYVAAIASRVEAATELETTRDQLAAAILPAARNEVFGSLR